MSTIRLASGDHPIDLRRSALVERSLRAFGDDMDVVAILLESSRDHAVYVERLAEALFEQEADAAVCPAGFLAAGVPQGIDVGAVFRETDPAYRCVGNGETDLSELPPGSKVVAWDALSRAQLRHRHPELSIDLLRSWSGLFEDLRHGLSAAACLPPDVMDAGTAWGLQWARMDPEVVVPAIGQSDVALLTLGGYADPLISALNDSATEKRLRFECAFWRCATEIPGVLATARVVLNGDMVTVQGLIADPEGAWLVRDEAESSARFGEFVAEDVAESCKRAFHVQREVGLGQAVS